jgi:hypothetical protein
MKRLFCFKTSELDEASAYPPEPLFVDEFGEFHPLPEVIHIAIRRGTVAYRFSRFTGNSVPVRGELK